MAVLKIKKSLLHLPIMKKHHCCSPFLKLNTKRLMFLGFVSGFMTLAFLLFVFINLNNQDWVSQKILNMHNFPMLISFKFGSMSRQHGDEQSSKDNYLYKYIINEPNKCLKNSPFLILLIAVQSWQNEAREAIRKTWGREDFLPGVHILRLFMLGKETKIDGLQQKLLAESQQYNDIIQQDYLDTYNNLTLKTLMGLHWVTMYCPQASYVMKTDSDMFVNTEYLVYKLLKPEQPPRTNYFTGNVMKGFSPNRNKESKWYMSPELYPGERYPPFCSGTGYVFSGDLAGKILNISTNIRLLHLEDVFIGLCLDLLEISPVAPPKESDFNHWKVSYSHCIYNQLVTSHQFEPSELITYWNDLQQNKQQCG